MAGSSLGNSTSARPPYMAAVCSEISSDALARLLILLISPDTAAHKSCSVSHSCPARANLSNGQGQRASWAFRAFDGLKAIVYLAQNLHRVDPGFRTGPMGAFARTVIRNISAEAIMGPRVSDNSRRHMIPCHHLVEGHACIHIRERSTLLPPWCVRLLRPPPRAET